jgi:hypothetical protein
MKFSHKSILKSPAEHKKTEKTEKSVVISESAFDTKSSEEEKKTEMIKLSLNKGAIKPQNTVFQPSFGTKKTFIMLRDQTGMNNGDLSKQKTLINNGL